MPPVSGVPLIQLSPTANHDNEGAATITPSARSPHAYEKRA